jgi:N-acetylated-alpha-linked acidic dipeptidase
MDKFGDPGWFQHQQVAQMWGLSALRLAMSSVVGFNATVYAYKLEGYCESLRVLLLNTVEGNKRLDLSVLEDAVGRLSRYAKQLDSKAYELIHNPTHQVCYFNILCLRRSRGPEIARVNKAYLEFERGFIGKGLPGRPVYKHVIYAPGTWEGYAGLTFPSIREAIAEQNWTEARDQVGEIAHLLRRAASKNAL